MAAADVMSKVAAEIARSRKIAGRVAATAEQVADAEERVAATYDLLAAERGDAGYRERAVKARAVAARARAFATQERRVNQER